jgi:hypothetical protein
MANNGNMAHRAAARLFAHSGSVIIVKKSNNRNGGSHRKAKRQRMKYHESGVASALKAESWRQHENGGGQWQLA